MTPATVFIFTGHAVRRMVQRNVTEVAVREVLAANDVIENYPDDTPYPSALYVGIVEGHPLHVVAALDAPGERTIIVTVYEPDPTAWDATFRKRRAE